MSGSRIRVGVDLLVISFFQRLTDTFSGMELGTRVSVGSGFTAEQRLRYAQNPSAIVRTFTSQT